MGRLPSGNARKYQIMTLWERHHAILRLLALGYTPKQIADQVGCTTATVGNVQHGELGRRQVAILRGAADSAVVDINADIKRLAPIAVERLEQILTDDNSEKSLIVKVAQDLLDRAGHAAPKVIQGQFTSVHLTKEDIEDLKKRAMSIVAVSKEESFDYDVVEDY
jgi:transcriptional regulator with XRE-family HTH domain